MTKSEEFSQAFVDPFPGGYSNDPKVIDKVRAKLAAAERLAGDMGRILSVLDTFPILDNNDIVELVRELATDGLTAWQEANRA